MDKLLKKNVVEYKCDGMTTVFAVPFYFSNKNYLAVQVEKDNQITTLKLDTDYSVIGEGNRQGGSITVYALFDNKHIITIRCNSLLKTKIECSDSNNFFNQDYERISNDINNEVDKIKLTDSSIFSEEIRTLESFRVDGMSDYETWLSADKWAVNNRGVIYVPGRDYKFLTTLNLSGMYICSGIGKTRLIFNHGGDGVIFHPPENTSGWQFGFKGGLTICTDGINAGTAVSTKKGFYFKQRPKLILESVEVQDFNGPDMNNPGFPCIHVWACGFDLGDVQGLEARQLFYYGNYNPLIPDEGQLESVALRLNGTQTMLFPSLNALWFNAPRRGIEIGDNCFFFIDSVDITRCWEGVVATSINSPFSEVFINRLAVNAQKTGVDLRNLTRLTLNESFINSRVDGFEHSDEWIGYKLTNIKKSTIGSITAQPNKKYGGTICAKLINCGGINLTSLIVGNNNDFGLVTDGCSSYSALINWQSTETGGLPYYAVNKSRGANVKIVSSASWLGNMYKFDSTIDYRQQNIEFTGGATGSCLTTPIVLNRIDMTDFRNVDAANRGFRITAGADGSVAFQLLDSVTNTGTNAIFINRLNNQVKTIELRALEVVTGICRPTGDNIRSLGTPDYRWNNLYVANGTIKTSDGRLKTDIRTLSEKEKNVALKCKSLIKSFKSKEAVEAKSNKARTHFSVVAQDIKNAFESEGLIAEDYAIFCHDQWDEVAEVLDEDGKVIKPYSPAGDRFGIRYDELLCFIISAI